MNTNRALAKVHAAARRAGLPAEVTAELWTVASLTPAGQAEAIARWWKCAETWPKGQ